MDVKVDVTMLRRFFDVAVKRRHLWIKRAKHAVWVPLKRNVLTLFANILTASNNGLRKQQFY